MVTNIRCILYLVYMGGGGGGGIKRSHSTCINTKQKCQLIPELKFFFGTRTSTALVHVLSDPNGHYMYMYMGGCVQPGAQLLRENGRGRGRGRKVTVHIDTVVTISSTSNSCYLKDIDKLSLSCLFVVCNNILWGSMF